MKSLIQLFVYLDRNREKLTYNYVNYVIIFISTPISIKFKVCDSEHSYYYTIDEYVIFNSLK